MGNISLKYDNTRHHILVVTDKPKLPAQKELPFPEIYSNKRTKKDYYKLELKEEQSIELNTLNKSLSKYGFAQFIAALDEQNFICKLERSGNPDMSG